MTGRDRELLVCDVRVEIAGRVSAQQVRADLDAEAGADPARRLDELDPRVRASADGRVELTLSVPGPDLWTSALTAMAVLRQLGYDVDALQVASRT